MGGIYWIASYPKSGNTWFRIFLRNLIEDGERPADINEINTGNIASSRGWLDEVLGFDTAELEPDEVDRLRPEVYRWSLRAEAAGYHKIHDAYTRTMTGEPLVSREATLGAIYILRNPLDVAPSYANHKHCSIDDAIQSMEQQDHALCRSRNKLPDQTRQKLLTWSGHVLSWVDAPGLSCRVLRYEDMLADPVPTFTKAARFLQLPSDGVRVEKAIRFSDFSELSRQEKEKGFREKPSKAKRFFRQGKSGDWREKLTTGQIQRIIDTHGEVMQRFGFLMKMAPQPEGTSTMLAIFDRKRGTLSCTLNREDCPEPIGPNGLPKQQPLDKTLFSPSLFTQNHHHCFLFGCIDNRDDLCARLGIDRSEQLHVNNAELLFRLFAAYGEATPTNLCGNWLYVIWDDLEKALWLAQNRHEYAVLYYHENKDFFSFSTSQHRLLALAHVPRQLDLIKIVQRDAIISHVSVDETYFQGIRLLNPAHWMKVTRTGVHRERYWHPERIPVDHRIAHHEAVAQMLFLFQEAVNKRIRHGNSVSSMLSGGLDSGSVVTVAAKLLREQGRTLHTYSHVPHLDLEGLDIGGRTGNEKPFMEATAARHANIVSHFIDSAHLSLLQGIRESNRILLEPIHAACNAYWLLDLPAQAAANGHDVLLSGEMGNATISYSGCLDALPNRMVFQRFGLKRFVRQRILKPPHLLAKRGLQQIRRRSGGWQAYSYLHPRLALALDLEKMIRQSGRPVDFSTMRFTNHQQQMQRILEVGFNTRLKGMYTIGRHFGLMMRDPTGDVPLIEFILSLPNAFFFGPKGEPKWMLKQTMKNRMPDEVLFQKSKGLQSADVVKRVQPDLIEIESIIQDFNCSLHEEPLFDRTRMLKDLNSLRRQEGDYIMAHLLLRSVGIMEFINSFG